MLKRRKSKKTDRKYWIDQLDKVFSLYIRMRDSRKYNYRYFRCISCGKVKPFEQMDAGHYIGRRHMALRWNPMNIHGECRACNRLDSTHLLSYRKNLIIKLGEEAVRGTTVEACLDPEKKLALVKKIGTRKVEELEAQKFTERKWTVEELQDEYRYFAALVLEMKQET